METLLDPTLVILVAGLAPLAVAALSKQKASSGFKGLLLAILATGVPVIEQLVTGYHIITK